MSLDKNPLLNDSNETLSLTQNDFISRFNGISRVMVSAPDIYEAGKSADKKVIKSLQKDFNESWIVTSTRINYEDSLEGTITHYFGSDIIPPNEKRIIIPYYNKERLDNVLDDEQGLLYLQVLFNTNDDPKEIKKILKKLNNKTSDRTYIWTPDQVYRTDRPDRAVGFNCNDDDFLVYGNSHLNDDGRSRGVAENPIGVAHENKFQETNGELKLPFELNSGINKKAECVYLSNTQNIGSFIRYAGLFCSNKNRFVISLTMPETDKDYDKNISGLLSKEPSPKEALNKLYKEFSPIYAHLLRYGQGDEGFTLTDDLEAFGEPRIKEIKK